MSLVPEERLRDVSAAAPLELRYATSSDGKGDARKRTATAYPTQEFA